MTLDFQVVQSQANERLNAFEILRAMLAHQDQSLEEWQDRTEASDPKSKELEIELEESKNKLRGAGWKFSREQEMVTFVEPAMHMKVGVVGQENLYMR